MRLFERPGRWLIILPPLLFLTVFFLIPFAFAFKISLAETAPRVPPFTDILTRTPDGHLQLSVTFANFKYLLSDEVYGVAYLYSLKTAFFATLICLALGYPMAYAISRASKTTQSILLLIIILPFWTSFLVCDRRGVFHAACRAAAGVGHADRGTRLGVRAGAYATHGVGCDAHASHLRRVVPPPPYTSDHAPCG